MALLDALAERLAFLRTLAPSELKRLSNARVSDLLQQEALRAKARVAELERRFPSAKPRELVQHLIERKKGLAGMVGGVSGVFGLLSLPADLLVMAWLQLALLAEIATVYKVNLKTARARTEILDLFGYATGVGPLARSGPKVLGKLVGAVLERGGLKSFGRAVPLVAAPISAYLNNQHIQAVGEQAVRFYEGFDKAHAKSKRAKAP